ncbi:hypothetical protein ACHAO7_012367, partial [Fusarium culmorum]
MSLISIFSIDANYVTEKAKHKVKKPACPQKGSQGRSLPLQNLQLQNLQLQNLQLQNLQLQNIVQVQPAIRLQAVHQP